VDDQLRTSGLDPVAVRRRLDIEIGEVRAAILMVGSGAASRVRLTGLVFGEELVERLRDDATRAGVRLVPEFRPEDSGCDLSVEAPGG
jgi:hypothetical protein